MNLEEIKRDCELWKPIGTRRSLEMVAEIERLRSENATMKDALHQISLASQNSMSSQRECGVIARAALAKVEQSK